MTLFLKKIFFAVFLAAGLLLWSSAPGYANNIAVSNPTINTQSTALKTCAVQFDVTWEHSWRNVVNYDAAWIFVKYSTDSGSTWAHATMKTSGTNPSPGFSVGAGTPLDLIVPPDKKGAFLQRSAVGQGPLTTTGIKLIWDWGADKLSQDGVTAIAPETNVRVKVFAIEMVYIPTGAFYIGDGNGTTQSNNAFYKTPNTSVQIVSTRTGGIKANGGDAQLSATGIGIAGTGGLDSDNNGSIDNAGFPTGYNAFYLMKYEISNGQYRDFLNTLTRVQQINRVISDVTGDTITNVYVMANQPVEQDWYGLNVRAPASGNGTANPITFGCDRNANGVFNESNDGEWESIGLIWQDAAAYGDWAALRPITELEYEKACRGPLPSVLGEYAWGNTILTPLYADLNPGMANEVSSRKGKGMAVGQGGQFNRGRTGMFATDTSSRLESSASYYGVMELSGNVYEQVVYLGYPAGRSFTGLNGDGSLDATGYANVANWPTINGLGATVRDSPGGDADPAGWTGSRVSDRGSGGYDLIGWSRGSGGRQSGRFARTA